MVIQPNADELIIAKSWKESLLPFIIIFIFFIIWYYALLSSTGHKDSNLMTRFYNIVSDEPPLLIFFIMPLFILLHPIYKIGNKVFSRVKYHIDGRRGIVTMNGRLVTSFSDIASMTLNVQKSEFVITLKNKDKIVLIKSKSNFGLRKVAEIISNLTKITITTG